jgi:anti-sigma regulatory factor (Ser/Thr protein kinase)
MFSSAHIALTDLTSVGEARRAGARMAAELGFNETRSGELAILITEAARNAVVHGGGGQIVLSALNSGQGPRRIDVMVLDKGTGIKDLSKALQDGYSTGGTPGTGLGAMQRMANAFEVFSNPQGTALLAQVVETNGPSGASKNNLEVAGLAVPVAGERLCGDGLAWIQTPEQTGIIAVDGLGHGLGAAEAAEEAIRIFHLYAQYGPAEILARIHDALRKTRGAAVSIAQVRPLAGTLTYAGVGNISAVILSDTMGRNLVSYNGTLGHIISKIQEFKVEWPRRAVLVMHSDGLQTRWDLSKYPGLLARNPALIAGVLFRDFRRQRDDTSVLVAKGI